MLTNQATGKRTSIDFTGESELSHVHTPSLNSFRTICGCYKK